MIVLGLIVVAGGLAVALIVGIFRSLDRLGADASAGRPHPPIEQQVRCLVALLAAGLAVAAAYSASIEVSLVLGGGIVLLFVLADATAVFVAIEGARFGQLLRTPHLGLLVAVGFKALSVASSPFPPAQSACACLTPAVP